MAYTIGNWSIDRQTVDTITSSKNLPIPDLSYATDFVVYDKDQGKVQLYNSTGSSLRPAEKVKYTTRRIADVYRSGLNAELDICGAQMASCHEGVNIAAEIAYMLKATNSVSGEEVVLPLRGALSLTVPTADFIPSAALEDLLKRTVSTMFATGLVDGTQAIHMARGDLDPTV